MKKYLEILKNCNLFENMSGEDILSVLTCLDARVECFDKKYTILAEGNPAKYMGIMLSGSAQIEQVDYYGNRSILSSILPCEVFAEAFTCAGISTIPVTVTAKEQCEVLLIDCNHILQTCSKNCIFHQQLVYNLMKDLASKVIMLQQKTEITSKRSTREKLMAYLMLHAKKANKDNFEIPFNRQELADYLEVDRSGLSAEISKLCKEGIIESQRKKFRLI